MNEQLTQAEIRRRMLDADRDRARIVYAYPDGLSDKQELRFIERARQTPEYAEAQARFDKYRAMLRDAERGPAALRKALRI